MAKRLYTYLLIALITFSCTDYGRLTRKGSVEDKYAAAVRYFGEKDYYKCSTLLESIMPFISGGEEFVDAMFIFAESYFYQGDYMMAEYYYKKFLYKFPRHEKVLMAEYMIAKSQYMQSPKVSLDQTQTISAVNSLQAFLNKYPSSEFAPECNNLIDELQKKLEDKAYTTAKLHLKIKNYKAAVTSFELFQKDFPSSTYNEELALLKIESQLELAKITQEKIKEEGKVVYLQKERYQKVVEYYYDFVDSYPSSKELAKAENYFKIASNNLKI
jgi:outer membrane protein assembly factor BamD